MKTLSNYLCKEFIKLLVMCEFVFFVVYLIIDFLQKVDNFIEAGLSTGLMVSFFLYKSPHVLIQMVPAATLISLLIMLSLMKRSNEITALKVSGLNIVSLSRPIMAMAGCVGVAVFFLSELVVPFSSTEGNRIWNVEVEKKDPGLFYGKDHIWYKGDNAIYSVGYFDRKDKILHKPTFYFFGDEFRMVKRIDGARGRWESGKWKIENGIIQEIGRDGIYELNQFKEIYLQIPETPETFMQGERSPEEMGYWELSRYAERINEEGYDNTEYLVEKNIKISFPFIVVVLALIGIPLALARTMVRTPVDVAIGIGICFVYMLIFGFSRTLGISGVLPPILSAWVANIAFLLLGTYLMIHVEK